MIKTITRLGNSQGLLFDATLLEMAHLKVGDRVNVQVHEGGTITVTPLRSQPSPADVTRTIRKTMKAYRRTMKKLA
jgi:antitoxin component of MazEF toxin-antitoxin module